MEARSSRLELLVRISILKIKGSKLGVKSDYDHSAIFGPTWVNIESKFGLAIRIKNFWNRTEKELSATTKGTQHEINVVEK